MNTSISQEAISRREQPNQSSSISRVEERKSEEDLMILQGPDRQNTLSFIGGSLSGEFRVGDNVNNSVSPNQ